MKTNTGIVFLLTLIMAFALGGCRGNVTPQGPADNAQPAVDYDIKTLATPGPGKSTVVGQVFDETSKSPMTNTPIRLAEVYREGEEGAYVLDTAFSPGSYTDDQGVFLLQEIPAGEYVLIVGDVMDKYLIIPDEENHPKTWMAEERQIISVGQLFVTLGQ